MKNRIKIKVKGNSTYPLNILSRRGVNIRDIRFYDNCIEFTIHPIHLPLCEEILNENNRKYIIKERFGLLHMLQQLRKRVGFIIGIVIFFIVSLCYSFTILTVEIKGNNLVSTEEIEKKVGQTINPPLFNAKIDKKRLERSITSISGISSASVSKVGTSIKIEVLEELPLPDMEDIKGQYQPIIAKHDSLITRIIVTSGTPLVKVGQAVMKGQELIAPYLITDEQTEVLCKAGGEVYGKVWLKKTKIYEDKEMIFTRTGKEYIYYDIKPLNWVKPKKEVPFAYYEEKKDFFYVGTVIPIKVIKYTYFETERSYRDFDFNLQSDILIKDLCNELDSQVPKGAKLLRRWHDIKRLDKKTQLVIYYEIETLIV